MIAVIPVLVARNMVRPVSSARMRDICRCWAGASESPNQATFETFTNSVASGNWRMISSPKASSQQMFGATSCPASASGLGRSEEHTSELQSHHDLVCRLLLEKKKKKQK